jgi:hypothetical protein
VPRVPVYEQQTELRALPGVRQQSIASPATMGDGGQLQQVGQALSRVGAGLNEVAVKAQERENADMLFRAETAITEEYLGWQRQVETDRRGAAARGLTQDAQKWWDESLRKHEGNLGNDAQRALFAQRAQARRLRSIESLSGFENRELDRSETESWSANRSTTIQLGQTDPTKVGETVKELDRLHRYMGARRGWTPEVVAAGILEDTTALHSGVIKSLIRGDRATEARAYLEQHGAQMTPAAREQIMSLVKKETDTAAGNEAAAGVWGTIGPKGPNDPVRIFDMEQRLREGLKDRPDILSAGIRAIRERAQGFNAQQAEVNAGNTNAVYGLIDSGRSMREIQRSDAWLALPERQRSQILAEQESRAATRASRAAAEANRAAAVASRNLSQIQTQERLNFMLNGDKYLTATDPAVLSQMSRAQVEAMRADFGMEPTQQLLSKWDALQKPGALAAANMDAQDFNAVADEMGLNPFKPTKSKEDRERLGNLQFRIETLIDQTQREEKRTLTREERMRLVRAEMAKTVTVNGWLSDPSVPVIALTPRQAGNVIVPPADRRQILDALAQGRARNPSDPRFAPTPENIRRLYLQGRSPAGALIPDAK